MARLALNDLAWEQVKHTLKNHGCYITKNTRDVLEAIIWKIRTGSPWRDLPSELPPWKTAYNQFNRWAKKGLWKDFFSLRGEIDEEWTFAQMEVTLRLTSMQVELGMVKKEQLESLEEALQQRCTLLSMRTETQLILKSLGVRPMTSKLHRSS